MQQRLLRLQCVMYGQDFYNRLTVSDFLMQFITMLWVMEDASNNDLMQELQKQNKEYLERILENQKEILKKLADLKG